MKCVQLSLDLFSPPSFEELIAKHGISGLSVTFKNRLHKSWSIHTTQDKQQTLILPVLLENAPEPVKTALLEWTRIIFQKRKKDKAAYLKNKKELEKRVWDYLSQKGVSSYSKICHPEKFTHMTKGLIYDLQGIFDDLNSLHFKNGLESHIRWGSRTSKTSYQTRCVDRNGRAFNLITIAGAYNHPAVPEFAIRSVVFHEMLHIAIPPCKKNGRQIIHGPDFKKAEKSLPYIKQWLAWEKNDMRKIIRSLKRRKDEKISYHF